MKIGTISNRWIRDEFENDTTCDICNRPGDVATFPIPEVYEGLVGGAGCTTRICMNCLHEGATAIYKLIHSRISK